MPEVKTVGIMYTTSELNSELQVEKAKKKRLRKLVSKQ